MPGWLDDCHSHSAGGDASATDGTFSATVMLMLLLVGCGQSPPEATSGSTDQRSAGTAPATASTTAPAADARATGDPPPVILHAYGISDVWFGMPDEAARQALVELWGEPDAEDVEFCELDVPEEESLDRTLTWGDLDVSLRAGSAEEEVRLAAWSVRGPRTPPGTVTPFGVVPSVDSKATWLRSVPDVREDEETNDVLGPGHDVRGRLQWIVDDAGSVEYVYVHAAVCE